MTMTLDSSGLMTGGAMRAGSRSASAFAAARRHSRFVRIVRRVIPIAAGLGFVSFVVAPLLNPFSAIGGLSMGPISLSGTKVTMENPKLTGFRKDNRPYEVTADSAVQDIRKPNVVDLNMMKARLDMESGWVKLESKGGIFDSQKEQMQLSQDIKVSNKDGHEAFLKSADIDFKAGTIRSKEPVRVSMGSITINADSLDVSDNGKIIVFSGRVSTLIDNSASVPGPDKKPAAQTRTKP